jgi:rod shape-determining protein MreD
VRTLRLTVVVFLLLVSLATWVPRIRVAGVGPDLLLGVVFFIALRCGAAWGVWTGVVLGLLVGVENPAALGRDSLALGLAGLLVGRGLLGLDRTSPLVIVVLIFVAAFSADAVRVIFAGIPDPGSIPLLLLRWALPGAFYTALVVPVLAWTAARLLGLRGWILGAA